MAKKTAEPSRTFHISVVGLSGTEKEKGQAGVGKSCLCNRFLHPLADEYYTDHISVLSQSDFSGPVVNNDHFLYWGEVTKTTDDGIDINFSVIEQTEFIDDASFQPFKGGKLDPYAKRCSAIKVISAEKLMYICKNQLGIEKEYEQKVLPDGKINVDGFVCVFDVSPVQHRTLEKQVDAVANILNNLMRTKKPVVLATTKSDEGCEAFVKEAERLLSRKEYRGVIPLVETSAHENINIELAFIVLAQMIDKSKGRTKIAPFIEATKARREILDVATDAYHSLIRSQVTDFRAVWATTERRLSNNQDFVHFNELFGRNVAQREFRRHVKRLKEEYVAQKKHKYLLLLPEVFHQMLPDLTSIGKGDWTEVRSQLKDHSDFNDHFVECPDDTPWEDSDINDTGDRRIPYELLDDSPEAETLFRNHLNALRAKQKTVEMKKQFKQLLEDAGYVTPGKLLSDVKVLFMGRECFEALTEEECHEIYEIHQKDITERAKQNFLELLQEHADRFYQLTSAVPTGAITQEDIKEIKDVLQEDSRYKALDRLEQDRQLILFQHLGFVHCPIREHCPSYPNCMDNLIEQMMASRMKKSVTLYGSNSSSVLSTDSNQLNLVLLGAGGIAEAFAEELRLQCEDDEYVLDNYLYTLEYRVISGDVSLPQNAFLTTDFLPHGSQPKETMRGCFCVYCDSEGFEYIRDSLEKTLMSNLEQDRLQFQDLPIVLLFAATSNLGEKDLAYLRDEGQSLSETFQCPFVEIAMKSESENDGDTVNIQREQLSEALRLLIGCIQHRASTLTIYQPQRGSDPGNPDIRVIMCLLCGDPYPVEHVLSPLLGSPATFVNNERSILIETYLGEFKRRVEVIVSSYHGANAFRDELVHGVILVYSTKRKASLATLKAFSMNIPNLPIQILAVTESGGANAFFSSNLSHSLIKEGNAIADQLQAHFMTATSTSQQKTAFYNPFFKEVWDKKAEIEHAFNMDEPIPPTSHVVDDSTLPIHCQEATLDKRALHSSSVVPTQDYQTLIKLQDGKNNREGHYDRLSSNAIHGDDLEEPLSPTYVEDRDQPRTPSDDSDSYYLYNQENGNSLVKPSQLRKRSNRHDENFAFVAAMGTTTTTTTTEVMGVGAASGQITEEQTVGVGVGAGGPGSYATIHHVTMTATYSYTSGDPMDHPPPPYHSVTHHLSATTTAFPHMGKLVKSRMIRSRNGGGHHHHHHHHLPPLPLPPILPSSQQQPPIMMVPTMGIPVVDNEEDEDADEELEELCGGPPPQPKGGGRRYGAAAGEGLALFPHLPSPPEPAPPDNTPPPPRRLKKATTIPSGAFSNDDNAEDCIGSSDSLVRDAGYYDDSCFQTKNYYLDEGFRSYTTGRRKFPPPTKPKPGKPQPGKLNLKDYGNVTNAIAKLSLTAKGHGTSTTPRLKSGKVYAPLATPESVELGPDYALVKDAIATYESNDEEYATVHDVHGGRSNRIRSAGRDTTKALTDSDSEWSSMERRSRDLYCQAVGRKAGAPNKKLRKRRGIPVATPRVPPLSFEAGDRVNTGVGGGGGSVGGRFPLQGSRGHQHAHLYKHMPPFVGDRMMAAHSLEPLEVRSDSPSDGSDDSDDDFGPYHTNKAFRSKPKFKRHPSSSSTSSTAAAASAVASFQSPPCRPICSSPASSSAMMVSSAAAAASSNSSSSSVAGAPKRKPVPAPFVPPFTAHNNLQQQQQGFGCQLTSDGDLFTPVSKFRVEQGGGDDDSGFEVSSPKDSSSPIMFRVGTGTASRLREQQQQQDKTGRRKDKQKLKDDEKLEKRRLKEEEKQKRLAEKEREKQEKKKPKKVGGPGTIGLGQGFNRLEEFAQSETNPIPLFLEKCIHFIEEEGLDSEGIYRVPGNRAHVDLLFQRFEEDPNVSIKSLDIPVNAVATALKDFFSKRLPHLMSQEAMNELIEISAYQDRSRRLLALRTFLKKLPHINFEILRFVFHHFVGVAENCKLNSMDSKNLAICWWPTLLPIEFTDMGVFERMRPHLEDAVQNMIDQYPFLFCDKEEVVMV